MTSSHRMWVLHRAEVGLPVGQRSQTTRRRAVGNQRLRSVINKEENVAYREYESIHRESEGSEEHSPVSEQTKNSEEWKPFN